ncbi:MAG: RsmD family RNA methyltransferase [Thermoanaerobaculia bacterium]
MIRIVAGELRGRRLDVDARIRPTMERARKAVFDILSDSVIGANVLDAAAGSGAYGIEALSRGAKRAEFIEPDAKVRAILLGNLSRLELTGRAHVHGTTIAAFLTRRVEARYDLVFHDPPYADTESSAKDLDGLVKLLAPEGTLFHERGDDLEPKPLGLAPSDRRRYGTTRFLIYRG